MTELKVGVGSRGVDVLIQKLRHRGDERRRRQSAIRATDIANAQEVSDSEAFDCC